MCFQICADAGSTAEQAAVPTMANTMQAIRVRIDSLRERVAETVA